MAHLIFKDLTGVAPDHINDLLMPYTSARPLRYSKQGLLAMILFTCYKYVKGAYPSH